MTAVKWAINGIPNGNATVGTITAGGVYSAPRRFSPTPTLFKVTATSLADTTAVRTGMITLSNPSPVVTAVLPTTIPVGDFTLVVTGQKFVSGAVVSFGGTFLPTTVCLRHRVDRDWHRHQPRRPDGRSHGDQSRSRLADFQPVCAGSRNSGQRTQRLGSRAPA